MKRVLITVASLLATISLWSKGTKSDVLNEDSRLSDNYLGNESLVLYKSPLTTKTYKLHLSHGDHYSHVSHSSHASHYSSSIYESSGTIKDYSERIASISSRNEAFKYYSDSNYEFATCYIVRLKEFYGKKINVVCLKLLGSHIVLYIPIGKEQEVYVIQDGVFTTMDKNENHEAILDIYKDDTKDYIQ